MNKRMKNLQMESVKDVDDRKKFRSDEISIWCTIAYKTTRTYFPIGKINRVGNCSYTVMII